MSHKRIIIIIGIDEERDRAEIEPFDLPPLSEEYLQKTFDTEI